MMKRFLLGAALCAFTFSVEAAENSYSAWSDPNAPQTQMSAELDKMIKELNNLVLKAEQSRAADPKFIQDLKKLSARYAPLATTALFKDDFSDGNFTNNPAWKLISGKYWVESGYGLRSFVELNDNVAKAQPKKKKVSNEEMVLGILGAVLGGKTTSTSNQAASSTTTTQVEAAEIQLPIRINNAFSINMDLSSWKDKGQFEFGPYQGRNLKTGYRLIYRAGGSPALELMRIYASGSSRVAKVDHLKLEDKKSHKLNLSRTSSGEMKVIVDGKTLIQTIDNSFKDDFSGFIMTNRGGDYIVKTVSTTGQR